MLSLQHYKSSDALDGQKSKGSTQAIKVIRIVKPPRHFKLVRVLKARKLLQIIDDLEGYLRLPPLMFRMARVLIMIVFCARVTNCTFWLIKENTNDKDEVKEWNQNLLYHPNKHTDSVYQKYVVLFFSQWVFGDICHGGERERTV